MFLLFHGNVPTFSIYLNTCVNIRERKIKSRKAVKGTTPGVDPIWRPVQQLICAQGNLCCLLFPATLQKVHVAGMSCCSTTHVPVPVFRDAAGDGRQRAFLTGGGGRLRWKKAPVSGGDEVKELKRNHWQ
jgi:hypothetical protein